MKVCVMLLLAGMLLGCKQELISETYLPLRQRSPSGTPLPSFGRDRMIPVMGRAPKPPARMPRRPQPTFWDKVRRFFGAKSAPKRASVVEHKIELPQRKKVDTFTIRGADGKPISLPGGPSGGP